MPDLLALSARYIDEGVYEGPAAVNPMDGVLSELAPGVAMVASFSHVVALATDAGLLLFDTSLEALADRVLGSLRGWSDAAVHTVAYTHGHVDHVGGAHALVEEARQRGTPRPRVVGHENVAPRFARYRRTEGYNAVINVRQFARTRVSLADARFGPRTWVRPDTTFRDRMRLVVGDLELELRHARGETDDHLWAWIPEHRALVTGDFLIWVFPNAGNPQKVQRYPLEWAAALREMQAQGAELLLPAHGLPIGGRERIAGVLGDTARALESIVEQSLELMNEGARLDALIHAVRVPDDLRDRPFLQPVYDEPEFVVRNVWRLYGGWYDGNPAHLKPAPEARLATELATLAGGPTALAARARELAERDELRLACELVELAALAAPSEREVHAARAAIYTQRRRAELSLMAKGIYGDAARTSAALAESEDQ